MTFEALLTPEALRHFGQKEREVTRALLGGAAAESVGGDDDTPRDLVRGLMLFGVIKK